MKEPKRGLRWHIGAYVQFVIVCLTDDEARHSLFETTRGSGNDLPRWKRAVCRFLGHPAGVWFYNPGGFEPDMTCKNCGDDLG